jgi:hypothetical protein
VVIQGAKGAWGALGALGAGAVFVASCSFLPAQKECAEVTRQLRSVERSVENIQSSQLDCPAGVFAGDAVKATVRFPDEGALTFERLGFNAFGSTAVNIVLAEAGGLVPRVASCAGVAPPNFHREAPLGHHFHPTLIDTKEAVSRHRELLEEVEFWPQCPQYWEVQDKRGQNYRYCARKKDATEEPPRPENCR